MPLASLLCGGPPAGLIAELPRTYLQLVVPPPAVLLQDRFSRRCNRRLLLHLPGLHPPTQLLQLLLQPLPFLLPLSPLIGQPLLRVHHQTAHPFPSRPHLHHPRHTPLALYLRPGFQQRLRRLPQQPLCLGSVPPGQSQKIPAPRFPHHLPTLLTQHPPISHKHDPLQPEVFPQVLHHFLNLGRIRPVSSR